MTERDPSKPIDSMKLHGKTGQTVTVPKDVMDLLGLTEGDVLLVYGQEDRDPRSQARYWLRQWGSSLTWGLRW